jgi:uncharacterized protein YutE (UPF0331/DUF86 family)
MGLFRTAIVAGATSAVVGKHAAKKQFESMQAAQAQQAQINQAQMQAAQAQQAAQAALAQQQASPSNQGKKDPVQELQKLATLKEQGVITEEEFQKLKMQLLSGA